MQLTNLGIDNRAILWYDCTVMQEGYNEVPIVQSEEELSDLANAAAGVVTTHAKENLSHIQVRYMGGPGLDSANPSRVLFLVGLETTPPLDTEDLEIAKGEMRRQGFFTELFKSPYPREETWISFVVEPGDSFKNAR